MELRNCYFCGCTEVGCQEDRDLFNDELFGYYIGCPECLCRGPLSSTEKSASVLWNLAVAK